MTYRILLVDDELPDLEGLLCLVPWERMGLQVVDSVNSPYKALSILQSEKIDIMLCDISMPLMSGLEMARQARELQPQLKVIFISGYQDFQYAKQAIALDACGYVLKPVDDRELEAAIVKTVQLLDEERDRQRKDDQWKETLPLLQKNRMRDWLEGTISDYGDTPEELADVPLCAVMIEIDDVAWKLAARDDTEKQAIVGGICQDLAELLGEGGVQWNWLAESTKVAAILHHARQRELVERLPDVIASRHPLTVTVGIGRECARFRELPISYRSAKEVLQHKMFYGKNRVISVQEEKGEISQGAKDVDETMKRLFAALMNYELVQIDDCIHDMFETVDRLGDKLAVYPFAMYIVNRLDQYLHSLNEELFAMMGWEWQHIHVILQFETIDDIKSWLRRLMFTLSELLYQKRNNKNTKLKSEIERYIIANIEQGITFQEVADHFAFSPNYLRYLFKKETGESISDYIVRQKMERAAELLKEEELRIYEIADRLAYSNITHFNRHFRETYGATPRDYRKQSRQVPR